MRKSLGGQGANLGAEGGGGGQGMEAGPVHFLVVDSSGRRLRHRRWNRRTAFWTTRVRDMPARALRVRGAVLLSVDFSLA